MNLNKVVPVLSSEHPQIFGWLAHMKVVEQICFSVHKGQKRQIGNFLGSGAFPHSRTCFLAVLCYFTLSVCLQGFLTPDQGPYISSTWVSKFQAELEFPCYTFTSLQATIKANKHMSQKVAYVDILTFVNKPQRRCEDVQLVFSCCWDFAFVLDC